MTPNILIARSLFAVGALILAICIPLLQGKIKRNALYGIRTPKAFESDELWFKINRYGARQMMGGAAVMMVLGLLTFALPFRSQALLMAWFGLVNILCVMVPCVQIFRFSNRL